MDRCDELMEYLAAYADGELEGDLSERVARHVDECERCRSECAALAKVAEVYRASGVPEVAEEDWARVSAALEKRLAAPTASSGRPSESAGRRSWFGWWLFPAAALAAALVLATFLVTAPVTTGEPSAQVVDVSAGASYDYSVSLPSGDDDFLIIDVINVE